jgi:hypothetical protein
VASKPETTFYTSVHRHLPPLSILYRMKNNNEYIGGVADHWYDATRDLWVEWKFIKVPKRDDTVIDFVSGKDPIISGLQQEWIKGRHANNRHVWVIVGCEDGGVIMDRPQKWQTPWSAGEFRKALQDRKSLAACIWNHCRSTA